MIRNVRTKLLAVIESQTQNNLVRITKNGYSKESDEKSDDKINKDERKAYAQQHTIPLIKMNRKIAVEMHTMKRGNNFGPSNSLNILTQMCNCTTYMVCSDYKVITLCSSAVHLGIFKDSMD